ncbi:ATP-dependent DNA helicase HMI1 mitochondrial precursor [Scheffersomyces amazonensis]|uniref:ATP-dependent DNA helicase HMI1 mitochondrial precursor n=1 Tax=Scheffersomyces amazonensis TaxID=1078765 RepID=UPI00315D74BD
MINMEDIMIPEVDRGDSVIEEMSQDSIKSQIFTKSQLDIVESYPNANEILLIKAGPGSGKTLTIARRILYLIEELKISPDQILVLSMTNRAVEALTTTLKSLSESYLSERVNISTFHSFCSHLLEDYGSLYDENYKNIRLLDDLSWRSFSSIFTTKTATIKGKSISGSLTPTKLEKVIASIKVGKTTIKEAASEFKISEEYLSGLIEYLNKNGMKRYPDFISDAIKLMNKSLNSQNLPVIHQLANYKIIIIDEFQDMHYSLLKIIQNISSYPGLDNEGKHITIAGDPNQCIYEFLGSDPKLFDDIGKHFPNFKVTEKNIEETFRLSDEVLKVSTEIALRPNGLLDNYLSSIKSVKQFGIKPIYFSNGSVMEEYDFIANEISRLILESGGLLKLSDIIILTRTNREIYAISEYFEKHYSIKCNKFGDSTKWVSSNIHIFLDILNILNFNWGSEFCLMCIFLVIDTKPNARMRIAKLFSAFETTEISEPDKLIDFMLDDLSNNGDFFSSIYKPVEFKHILATFKNFLEQCRTEIEFQKDNHNPKSIMESLLRITRSSNLLEYLNNPQDISIDESEASISKKTKTHRKDLETNVIMFYSSLTISYRKFLEAESDKNFIDFFLRSYSEDTPVIKHDMINLSTVHTAKGLEFPVVFIPGAMPRFSWNSLYTSDNEKPDPSKGRLLYVATTRTKSLLYVGSSEPLNNLSPKMNELFSDKLPSFNSKFKGQGTLLHTLSTDLNRVYPNESKLSEGAKLYANFFKKSTPKLARSFSTTSKIYAGYRSSIQMQVLFSRFGRFKRL